MMKRLFTLLLCVLLIVPVLASCSGTDNNNKKKEENVDKGAYIKMYLTDIVYDLDPAYSLNNKSAQKIVSLLYSGLFRLDEKGKVQKDLVKSYKITEDPNAGEYKMTITLNQTYWSDGIPVDAADVIYAWKRILDVEKSNPAAALLFDIKNARAVARGDVSIDDLGVTDPDELVLEITFEGKIDYDAFILNLTSPALVPLREQYIDTNPDWSKKPATTVCSGPFTLRTTVYTPGAETLVLERNQYYFRDKTKDKLDKSVTPYRLIIDYSLSDEELQQKFDAGEIFYIGEIPLSLREYYADSAEIADEMSTHVYYLNENALIRNGGEGEYLFANKAVRQALSLAIDREAIAKSVVFARAATGLVPYGVFETNSPKNLFRKVGGDLIATSANIAEAKSKLSAAGITPSNYSFTISVRTEDEVHVLIAEAVAASWRELGFNVDINRIACIVNDDMNKATGEYPTDIMDDIFNETLEAGNFEVIAVDLFALTPDAFSVLAPFAKEFAGQSLNMTTQTFEMLPHPTGYDSEAYSELVEKIYAAEDKAERASLLHDAEKMLVEDMPVIPIIFNQDAYVISGELSNVKTSYYQNRIFTKTKLKNYQQYIETAAE